MMQQWAKAAHLTQDRKSVDRDTIEFLYVYFTLEDMEVLGGDI